MWETIRGRHVYLGFCNCLGGIKDNAGLIFTKSFYPVETDSSGNCIFCGHAAVFKRMTIREYEKKQYQNTKLTNQKRLERLMAAVEGKKRHIKKQRERVRKMYHKRKQEERERGQNRGSSQKWRGELE